MNFAQENPTWGYDRIADALSNIGHKVSDQTVGNILKGHGIEPAPDRKRTTTWKAFIQAHMPQLAAIDFTSVEVWTKNGLVTIYLLFAMHLATRRVKFVGCTPHPGGPWMENMALELTNETDGFLQQPMKSLSENGDWPCANHAQPENSNLAHGACPPFRIKYVLMDRDSKFTEKFQTMLKWSGIEPVLLPPQSPNCNAYIGRFFRSLKSECLDRMIFFSEHALRQAASEFTAHYHTERNHQGLDHQIIDAGAEVGATNGEIICRERLGGLLKYYQRCAA